MGPDVWYVVAYRRRTEDAEWKFDRRFDSAEYAISYARWYGQAFAFAATAVVEYPKDRPWPKLPLSHEQFVALRQVQP